VYGEALGFEIRLSTADDSDFPDYDFMIDFEPLSVVLEIAERRNLDGFIDIAAKHLARRGRNVARSLDILSPGSGRVEY
jgi:hypothetical protein